MSRTYSDLLFGQQNSTIIFLTKVTKICSLTTKHCHSHVLADGCKVGVGICYDIRFAELAQIYAQAGCHLLLYPGAFNMTTGPAHWELLQKCR